MMVTDVSTLTKISEARVVTANGSSYLRKLCQHWAHKFLVVYDDEHGKIDLAAGKCILVADANGLTVRLMMPEDGDEPRLQQVLEEHIKRSPIAKSWRSRGFQWWIRQAATSCWLASPGADDSYRDAALLADITLRCCPW